MYDTRAYEHEQEHDQPRVCLVHQLSACRHSLLQLPVLLLQLAGQVLLLLLPVVVSLLLLQACCYSPSAVAADATSAAPPLRMALKHRELKVDALQEQQTAAVMSSVITTGAW